MRPAYLLPALALFAAASNATDTANAERLTLEQLFHPQQKIKFDATPLTRLSWDQQNRLVEKTIKDGQVQLFEVALDSGEKTLIPADGNLLALLKAAGIDEKSAQKTADELGAQIIVEKQIYVFSHNNDLWVLDYKNAKVTQLTSSPTITEDEAELSPDANHVAYLQGNDLYLSAIATKKQTRLTTGGSETVFNGRLDWVYQEELYGRGEFRAFWWSPDSKRIAFIRLDETKVPVYTLSGDFAQPITPNLTRYPKAGDPNPIAKLGVVNLKGKIKWTDDPYSDQESLIVQVGWTPKGELLASWQDRVQTWLDLRLYDQKLNSKTVVHESSPAWVERLPLPTFLNDGGFLWESERSGHHHIYRYNGNYELTNAVTQGDWDVREVQGIDEGTQRVFFVANERNPIGNDAYVVQFNGEKQTRLTTESGSHNVRWNKARTHFLDSWSSLTQTAKQAALNSDGKQLRLFDDNGSSDAYKKVQKALIKQQQIKTRDGFAMDAVLYLPPEFDANKKYPVFQHLYAGPMAPQVVDRWSNALWYHYLAQQGYVVFVLDNRSASNKGISSAWPIHKKLGQLELQDQLDGIEWLRQQGWADMDRIALEGWSYGGYMTAYAMTHSKAWKIGFVGAPVTDYRLYDSIYTERYMGLPQENAAGYDQGSVLKAAKDLNGKILIMHGSMDDNVHPQNSIMLIKELIASGKDYSLQLYPGENHGPRGDAMNWSRYKAMWEFLKTNL